jgi:hypothetical protein
MHSSLRIFSLLGCLAALGCSGEMVPASGRVAYSDGSNIEGAIRIIRFEPDDDTTAKVKKAASSEIAADGSFTLMTTRPGDGVYRGKYVVTFTVLESPETGKSLIKQKYSTFAESPFEVSVEGGKDDYFFELEKLE